MIFECPPEPEDATTILSKSIRDEKVKYPWDLRP